MTYLLGIIPARAGSKRLIDKNIRPFAGSSLLKLAIDAALQARELDAIGISTDSEVYLQVARNAGLDETYRRPAHLATESASIADAVIDYLNWRISNRLVEPSHVILLQPTSPFRDASQIDSAVDMWRRSGKPSLVSVAGIIPSLDHLVFSDERGNIEGCQPSRKADAAYVLDGAIFITPVEYLRTEKTFWNQESALFVNCYARPFDIDDETDFLNAQAIHRRAE